MTRRVWSGASCLYQNCPCWRNGTRNHAFAVTYDKAAGTLSAMVDLGSLGGDSTARGVSGDGSVIVGDSGTNSTTHPFAVTFDKASKTSSAFVDLDLLNSNIYWSFAYAVSADGTVIVGSGSNAFAVTFDKSTGASSAMVDLGSLGGALYASIAKGVSGDGSVIVGESYNGATYRAVATQFNKADNTVGKMIDLGSPSDDSQRSRANAVSADGSVIVGYFSANSLTRAFAVTFDKVTGASSAMVDLGSLGGGFDYAYANAVSADGSVIVGVSYNYDEDARAFAVKFNKATNTPDTMVYLGSLVSDSYDSMAHGVSGDGSVIVGQSYNGTVNHAVLWVDVFTDPYMVDATEWMQSIRGPSGILPIVTSLTSLPMEGAHHRPLMTLDAMGKTSQAWVTGDFGARSRTSDSHTTTGEAGVSHTFGNVLAGLAVGYGAQNNDLLFDGASHVSGQYLLAEIDAKLSDNQGIVSLTAMFGSWKSDTLRGYGIQNGLTDYSQGSTNLNSASVRLRFDGPSHKLVGGPFVTPFASFTWTRVAAEAYAETGGSFDAQFDAQEHQSREVRLGLSSKFLLSDKTTLLATAEWIHRFDKNESGFSGTDIDHNALPFDVAGAAITANQARLGLDVDHKLTPNTMLNFSVHAAGVGPSADVSGALSIRRAF